MQKILIATSFLAISACSGGQVTDTLHADATPENSKMHTASYFATSQRNVRVGNLKPGVLGTAYKARVAGTVYDCHYFKKTVSCNRA